MTEKNDFVEVIEYSEERDPLDLLYYEIDYFVEAFSGLVGGLDLDLKTRTIYLESFLLHARNLTEFLKRHKSFNTDISISDFSDLELDISDLEFKNREYHNGAAYRQSKQANRMLIVGWAQRFQGDGVWINACHPGDVNSNLSNNLGFGGFESPDQGAATPVWLATGSNGGNVSGKYFEHFQETRCRFGENLANVEMLFQKCLSYA